MKPATVISSLQAGELWGDGYFVRLVGDEVTAAVIRRYIKLQHVDQLRLDLWLLPFNTP